MGGEAEFRVISHYENLSRELFSNSSRQVFLRQSGVEQALKKFYCGHFDSNSRETKKYTAAVTVGTCFRNPWLTIKVRVLLCCEFNASHRPTSARKPSSKLRKNTKTQPAQETAAEEN